MDRLDRATARSIESIAGRRDYVIIVWYTAEAAAAPAVAEAVPGTFWQNPGALYPLARRPAIDSIDRAVARSSRSIRSIRYFFGRSQNF